MNESDHLTSQQRERKLSTEGESLYKLLNIEKTATQDEIKKGYRKMALKYHPDKNRDNPDAAEMFKDINKANAVLSDEMKRSVYDKEGSKGLAMMEQIGPEAYQIWMKMNTPLAKGCFCFWFLITGCCCCLCFCCCCNCCFGKCKPKDEDEEMNDEFGSVQDPSQPGFAQTTAEQPTAASSGAPSAPADASPPSYEEATVTSQPKN